MGRAPQAAWSRKSVSICMLDKRSCLIGTAQRSGSARVSPTPLPGALPEKWEPAFR